MQRYAAKYEKKEIFLHEHALEKLCSYHWPGNIRELQHTIEKRRAIETAIRQNDGNLTATAEQLGISRCDTLQ